MSKAGKLRVPEYLEHILEANRRTRLYIYQIWLGKLKGC